MSTDVAVSDPPPARQLASVLTAARASDPDCEVAWIAWRSATRTLRIRAVSGARSAALDDLVIGAGQGLTGRVFQHGASHRVDDYHHAVTITHVFDGVISAERITRMTASPIVVGGTTVGVLSISSRHVGHYGDRSLAHTEQLAARIAATVPAHPPARAPLLSEITRRISGLEELGRRLDRARSADHDADVAEIAEALRALDDAESRVASLLASSGSAPPADDVVPRLTPRQVQVLGLVAEGLSTRGIAERLGIGSETVKDYVAGALQRLGARTRAEAVATAQRIALL